MSDAIRAMCQQIREADFQPEVLFIGGGKLLKRPRFITKGRKVIDYGWLKMWEKPSRNFQK